MKSLHLIQKFEKPKIEAEVENLKVQKNYFSLFFTAFGAYFLIACSSVPTQTEIRYRIALFSAGGSLEHRLRKQGSQKAVEKLKNLEVIQYNSSSEPQVQLKQLQGFLYKEELPDALLIFPLDGKILEPVLAKLRKRGLRIILAGWQAANVSLQSYDLRISSISDQQLILNLFQKMRDFSNYSQKNCLISNFERTSYYQMLYNALDRMIPDGQRYIFLPVTNSNLPNLDECQSVLTFEENLTNKLAWYKIRTSADWELFTLSSPTPIFLSYIQSSTINWLLDPADESLAYAASLTSYFLVESSQFSNLQSIDLSGFGRLNIDKQRNINLSISRIYTPYNAQRKTVIPSKNSQISFQFSDKTYFLREHLY